MSSSEFVHRLCGCPMYYILNICSVTISALYFGPRYELSRWLPVLYVLISLVHPSALCLIALHRSRRKAVCRQKRCRDLVRDLVSPQLRHTQRCQCHSRALSTAWREAPSPKHTWASCRPCPKPGWCFGECAMLERSGWPCRAKQDPERR